jgi:hypothetical protein
LYEQIHISGMDINHVVNATAAVITLGFSMTMFRVHIVCVVLVLILLSRMKKIGIDLANTNGKLYPKHLISSLHSHQEFIYRSLVV